MKAAVGRNLRRRQLDRVFGRSSMLHYLPAPERGWIREVREAIGMSAQQLAKRMNVSQPTVAEMEHSEAAGMTSIHSLRRAAEAMGCSLVYAFVPPTSLEAIVRAQAERVATGLYEGVNHSMALEAQSTAGLGRDEQIAELADELVRTLSRDLWEQANEVRIPGRGDAA